MGLLPWECPVPGSQPHKRSRPCARTAANGYLAVMTETMQFGELTLWCDQRAIRPRPWTAAQSDWAAELAQEAPPGRCLELFSGVGPIGLRFVKSTGRELVQIDNNPFACHCATVNAHAARLHHLVQVRCGDATDAISQDERFALIVADPPWVRSARTGQYPEDPLDAIDGGSDGLAVAREALQLIPRHLLPDGEVILQLGSLGQVGALRLDRTTDLQVLDVRVPGSRGVLVRLKRGRDVVPRTGLGAFEESPAARDDKLASAQGGLWERYPR